jgi:hypothetical protein
MNKALSSRLALLAAGWGLAAALATACGGGSALPGSETTGGDAEGPEAGADGGGSLNLGGGLGQGGNLNLGGDSSTAQGGADCGATRFEANATLVNVLIVVDRSGSMTDEPDGFDTDKWTALRGALESTFEHTKANISYGLDLYPYSGKSGQALAGECQMPSGSSIVVPIQAGDAASPKILAALDENPPEGGTPTAAALARALAYFTSGAGKSLQGDRYVLLATDGGPNCNDALTCTAATCTLNLDGKSCGPGGNCCDSKLDPEGPSKCLDEAGSVAAVSRLSDAGIKTIVVGIPGTEAYAGTLDALAEQSPVQNPDAPPRYFAVSAESGVAGLAEALSNITTGLITSCNLNLDQAPPDPSQLFVVIDGVQLARDDADGWVYDDDSSPPVVRIQGQACEKLKSEGAEYINVTYGCPDFRPPVR